MATVNHASLQSRLGCCEVCDANPAKYTCPQCEVKTCSLPCINIHKKELECEGIRNRVKYVPLNKFTNMDLQSDYILLEEAVRTVERVSCEGRRLTETKGNYQKVFKLKRAARIRRIRLELLPQKFTRHRNNSTYLNWKTGELFWKVQWIFPEANNYTVSDPRILDTCTLEQACFKHLPNETEVVDSDHQLSVYSFAKKNEIKILLKAERVSGDKFYETDLESTISQNLRGKLIVEHPIFYVILSKNLNKYEILREAPIFPEEDQQFREMNESENFFSIPADNESLTK